MNPYQVTKDLEAELCNYTDAKYAVCVNSCTAALLLAVKWLLDRHIFEEDIYDQKPVEIPQRTYVSVPCAIKLAGASVRFRDEAWRGEYQLKPLPVWDCARRFTSGMYRAGEFQCVSFSTTKILGIEQGGAILHDNPEADGWFRRMRFDGRTEGVAAVDDTFREVGHHCIMLPSIAAQLLLKLYHLPQHNEDLPEVAYPDLSKFDVFK